MYQKTLISVAGGLWALMMTQLLAAQSLTITLENVKESSGTIMLQLMHGEAEFKGEAAAFASYLQRAQQGTMTFQSNNLPNGEYAVRIMHDLNGNGELDTNFVGMPTEPWAMSNNARGHFGPPTWKQVKFTVSGESVSQTIKLSK